MTASSNAMPSVRNRYDGMARTAERLVMLVLIVCGAILIVMPLLLTLYLSLFDEKLILFPPRGYTLEWYSAIVPNFGGAIVTSLKLGMLAVFGSLALGVPAGIGLARHRFRGRGVISTLLLAPLTVPAIALGLAIYVALVALDEQFGSTLTGSMAGLVLAHIMITTPWVVRLCLASLTNHDRAAEEAAASLGAGPPLVIWRVTLPAMRSGIIAAALFAFVISFENLELALFLTGPGVTTLPVAVLQYLEYHIDPLVSAVAVAQIVVVAALLLVLDRFVRLGQMVR
ncbi:MAG TPA: ABC transporter permease [Acetobacteraceae bacterium]|jgi:putative spermidine/putrescine transport system permease protein|nr:ABC transporter permease [Acetobacteraceae bacterium]